MPKSDDVKKFKSFNLHSELWISPQTSKRFNAVIGSIAINIRLTYTDFPEKYYIEGRYHHEPYDSGTQRLGAAGRSKDKKKANERAFRAGIQ